MKNGISTSVLLIALFTIPDPTMQFRPPPKPVAPCSERVSLQDAVGCNHIVYGLMAYRETYSNLTTYDSWDPWVCYGSYGLPDNITSPQYFVCPSALRGDTETDTWCCGGENIERCCGYWESSQRVIALVMSSLALVTMISLLSVCICWRFRLDKKLRLRQTKAQNNVELTHISHISR